MATLNIPQQPSPQVNRRRLAGLAAIATTGLVLTGTIFTVNQLSNDDPQLAPLVQPFTPAAPALASSVSPTVDVVVGSAVEASVYEQFLSDTGVKGIQVRVVASEEARQALDREISFRRSAGEDVTVSYRL
ncbi:MAG: hypothetical protein ACKVVT_04275 [Dehalococcoidia bacterium]